MPIANDPEREREREGGREGGREGERERGERETDTRCKNQNSPPSGLTPGCRIPLCTSPNWPSPIFSERTISRGSMFLPRTGVLGSRTVA